MNDRYVHLHPLPGKRDHRHDNLVTLGRHLALNASAIRAGGGLAFTDGDMAWPALPLTVAKMAESRAMRPPLAHGPYAGLPPLPNEGWPAYCERVFGICGHRPFMAWLQSPMWRKTDPSPEGAALRIAYVLDYGVPHDHVEIAMGQAYSDYDSSGILWERLRLFPLDRSEDGNRVGRRRRPAWIGAVDLNRRRAEIRDDYLIPPGEMPFSAGFPLAQIAALTERIGPIPDVYHDFLLLSGRRACGDGTGPYADRLEAIDRLARERIFGDEREEDDPVPRDAIFIGVKDGRHPEFILSGRRQDSPVFLFDADTGRVTQTAISIFTWIEAFMKTAGVPAAQGSAVPPETSDRVAGGKADRWFVRMFRRLFG